MPLRARRPCKKPGCRNVAVAGRFCQAHSESNDALRPYDLWRGTPAERGYDAEWKRVRKLALDRDHHLCQRCLGLFTELCVPAIATRQATPATDVHHIITIAIAPHLRLDLDNLVSLCKPCHSLITALRDSAFAGPRGQMRHRR